MPLTTSRQRGVPDADRKSICVWMLDEALGAVRVCVTCEALYHLDSYTQPQDVPSALAIFEMKRGQIEATASRKFDANGATDGEHQGRPLLILRTDDFAS